MVSTGLIIGGAIASAGALAKVRAAASSNVYFTLEKAVPGAVADVGHEHHLLPRGADEQNIEVAGKVCERLESVTDTLVMLRRGPTR